MDLRDRGTYLVSDFDWLVQLRYFIEENPEKPGGGVLFQTGGAWRCLAIGVLFAGFGRKSRGRFQVDLVV